MAISGYIELLPVSILTGVLFMVVLSTFQWKTFILWVTVRQPSHHIGHIDSCFFFNFALAIAAGIIFSAFVHAWDSGTHVDADIEIKPMLVKREGHVYEGVEHADD